MTLSTPIRKVFQGVPDRRQMFRMFDRHAQWPSRGEGGASRLAAEIERRQRSGPACCVSAGAAGESWSRASARGYFPR